jgi:cytochrome oxidase Cu insertion factor (SCO1/SenC/PrrC family)
MKILKLLNKKNLSIIIFSLLITSSPFAEDKPVDIWNIEKKEVDTISEENLSDENKQEVSENSIYKMQSDKKEDSIKLDADLTSKTIKIAGLYDPQDYGLSINMWSNSDGLTLKKLFNNIDKYDLSKDASEILNISLLTNAYYPNQNITDQEFLKYKTKWLIKNSDLDLIEEYLIKNQVTNLHPELMRYMVDRYLSQSDIKRSCEIFSKIKEPLEDEYLSKFNLYCLINYGKNEEAQLILDLKKELGFLDEYFENKINYLFGYIDEANKEISENSILDFHLAHRTNPEFTFEPNKDTPKLIWKYLSSSNLLYRIQDLEITDIEKISTIEKATHDKNYSEEELFEFYKRFQFNINQLLNTKESYKSLSSIEGKALVYQRLLLAEEPKLKLELMKILKDIFKSEGIEDAFDEELRKSLKQIDETDVPSNFTTFYNQYIKSDEIINKKIKYNNKILHQSKLVNYFNGDYAKSKIEEDLDKFLKKIKKDKKYSLSKKDIIFLEALKSDGIEISKKYENLYKVNKSEMPSDIQKMIDNKEIGAALLRIIEVIGPEKIEDIDDDTVYFIINTLNQLNTDSIRNKLLLKVLPLKV